MKRKPIVIAVVLILVLTISIVAVGCSNQNDIVHFEDINKDDLCFFLKAGRIQLETI